MKPELNIRIEIWVDDDLVNKEETSNWEVAEMKLDIFKRKFEKEQVNQQEDAMNK